MSPLWRSRPDPQARAEEADLRRKLYRVQAAAFLDPPDEELIAFLAADYPFLFPDGPPDGEEALRVLRVDFTHLFVLSSPPYEAALLEESGHLNSRVTDSVTDFYRACGFNPGRGSAGASHPSVLAMDHLSAELEFLAHLAGAEAEAWREGTPEAAREQIGRAARFLDEHLLRWMPLFTLGVEQDAQTAFYRELAGWTRAYVLEDRNHIGELLKRI